MTETETEEKTEFKFSELSDKAKQTARDAWRYSPHYLHDNWWDSAYDKAVEVAKMLGITIEENERPTRIPGVSTREIGISFSGFYSQGDGACFIGEFTGKTTAHAEVVAYAPEDEDLIDIARELTALAIAQRFLTPNDAADFTISTSGNYSHSGTMSIAPMSHLEWEDDEEDTYLRLMRAFADWIYEMLEAEHDYLMSDDVVDDDIEANSSNDQLFDELGSII